MVPKNERVMMRVIIGGTFGYLHKGHRALISKAFEIGDYVYIGLTSDRYVHKAKHAEKLPSYADRKRALVGFVKGFGKKYSIRKLEDRYGPSIDGDFDAIVVSDDTLPAALEINKIRSERRLGKLEIIKIALVKAEDAAPISTSKITRGEIDSNGRRLL